LSKEIIAVTGSTVMTVFLELYLTTGSDNCKRFLPKKLKLKLNALNDKLNKTNFEEVRKEKHKLFNEIQKIKPYCIYKESSIYLGRHEQGILKEVGLYQKQEMLNEQEQIKLLTELEDITKKQLNKISKMMIYYKKSNESNT
jgi:hypothetical protein